MTDDGTTRRPGTWRQGRGERAILLGLERLERQVVGVERPIVRAARGARRTRIGRGSVELREGDVLLIDGHAKNLVRTALEGPRMTRRLSG